MQKTELKEIRTPEYWLVLCTLCVVSVFYYGIRAAAVLGLAAVTAVLTDFICLFLRDRSYKAADLANVGTALVLCLMLPATVPYSIVILSTVFAVAVGTHVFGAGKDMLFPPAAVGYLFALVSWKDEIISFPKPGTALSLFGNSDAAVYPSFSHLFNTEERFGAETLDLLIGAVNGPMGTGCLLLLIVGLCILMFRGGVSYKASLGFLTGAVLASYGFWLTPAELFGTNMILFAAVFLAADPSVVPKNGIAPWIGGVFTGLLTEYLIYAHDLEYAAVIAVIVSCPVWRGLAAAEVWCMARLPKKKAAQLPDEPQPDAPAETEASA